MTRSISIHRLLWHRLTAYQCYLASGVAFRLTCSAEFRASLQRCASGLTTASELEQQLAGFEPRIGVKVASASIVPPRQTCTRRETQHKILFSLRNTKKPVEHEVGHVASKHMDESGMNSQLFHSFSSPLRWTTCSLQQKPWLRTLARQDIAIVFCSLELFRTALHSTSNKQSVRRCT